jgi:hypothetical protein
VEKLIYPLWKADARDADDFRDALLASLGGLVDLPGVRGLRLSVADSAVAAAGARRMAATRPLPDAMVSVWLDAARHQREQIEAALEPLTRRHSCYLVTESEPLASVEHPPVAGERAHGMCQVVFLQRPPRLCEQTWLDEWQGRHTQVAIDTQSTFGYRQNVIVRGLSYGAPVLHAMIEEYFPPAAMASDYAFYNVAEGDDEGLAKHAGAMVDSCARFIDFDRIDVIPMSDYLLKAVA